jgi:pilus assembly protein CpaE
VGVELADSGVLLIGDGGSDAVERVLARGGRGVTRVADPDEAVKVAATHAVIVIDALPQGPTATDVCRRIRGTEDMPAVPILVITGSGDVEERIALLEAGADDVMIRPIDERELEARVEALDLRFRRAAELRPTLVVAPTRRGDGKRLIVVFSPKGGVGTTTIAVNLALAIARRAPDRVALVDLAPSAGHVASNLDVRPKLTIADLARDSTAARDADVVRNTYLVADERGILVLAGAPNPAAGALLTGELVSTILETVLSIVPTVVVDGGSYVDERLISALGLADDVVVPVTPDYPALKSVHSFFEYLAETGTTIVEPAIVVNETYAHQVLSPADIQNALGKRVAVRVPYDPLLFVRAVNEGRPIMLAAPGSPPSRRIDDLAAIILGDDAPQLTVEPRRRGLAGLFSRS